ncbi:unnamed protein product [Ectocarpus sp. 12 AP-2014]
MTLPSNDDPPRCAKKNNMVKRVVAAAAPRHSGEGEASAREGGRRTRGRAAAAALSGAVLVLLVAGVAILGPPQNQQRATSVVGVDRKDARSSAVDPRGDADGVGVEGGSGVGMTASSSMWGVAPPAAANEGSESIPVRYRRGLLFNGNAKLRGGAAAANKVKNAAAKPQVGEHGMLHDFTKTPLDTLDLDDVKDGHLWIPVSVNKFDNLETDPLVKMCQVNYDSYSEAPWLLPMGGLLSIASGCADLKRDTVQIVHMSTLKRLLEESTVPIPPPTGFIFHETRCGSTLVANMLASVETNVMWSESTGPWKVMHTCPKCHKEQIVPWLRVIMDAMTRSARHDHFYFKFQSSEDIDAVTSAYPDTPWIFIFREPIEVMMSRLGAQRIGMEGMEKEVAARVERGMKTSKIPSKPKLGKPPKETSAAQLLSGLCKKAIHAFEENPGKGMMVEYPHLPHGIVSTVLPDHYGVTVSEAERERMMSTTQMYSKVASFAKGSTTDSKFTEDTDTKHEAASVAVQEAAQRLLYPDYYKLRSMSTWPVESV